METSYRIKTAFRGNGFKDIRISDVPALREVGFEKRVKDFPLLSVRLRVLDETMSWDGVDFYRSMGIPELARYPNAGTC